MKTIKLSNNTILFLYLSISIVCFLILDNVYPPLFCITVLEIFRQIKNNNFVTGYTFWSLGFLFIICLDGILLTDRIIEDTSRFIYLKTAAIFYISDFIIIYYYRKMESKRVESVIVKEKRVLNISFFLLIVFLYILFIYIQLPQTFEALLTSRHTRILNNELGGLNVDKSIIKTLSNFFTEFSGFLLPSFIFVWIAKKYNPLKSLFIAFFFSIPIWLIYFGLGTRHFIVYSFFGLIASYALINSKKIKFRYYYIVFLLVALFVSNLMLEARRHGVVNYFFNDLKKEYVEKETPVTDLTTVYMSYAVNHHLEKPLYYGKSTGALVFFWVPRRLWKDKPTQFGYWFIRDYYGEDYRGFSKKHSAPASYLAAPYSDFGFLGVIIVSWLIALLLNKLDVFFRKNEVLYDHKKLIFVSFFLASVFFLPRQLSHLIIKGFTLYLLLLIFFFFNKKKLVLRIK